MFFHAILILRNDVCSRSLGNCMLRERERERERERQTDRERERQRERKRRRRNSQREIPKRVIQNNIEIYTFVKRQRKT